MKEQVPVLSISRGDVLSMCGGCSLSALPGDVQLGNLSYDSQNCFFLCCWEEGRSHSDLVTSSSAHCHLAWGGVACHLSLGERRHPLGLIYAIYSENPAHSCLLSKYICDLFMGNQWFQGLSAQQCYGE